MSAGDVLAFLLETTVYLAVGCWGFTRSGGLARRIPLGLGAVAALAVVWGLLGAPTAVHPLHGVERGALEALWFGAGALALYRLRGPRAAWWFGAVWAVCVLLRLGA